MSQAKPRIWFIGPFPPPLTGQSNYNSVLQERLQSQSELICLDTGKSTVSKICAAFINSMRLLLAVRRSDVVYTSAPGQMGLWLFIFVVAALRLRRIPHFVHHHSYRSINLAPLRSHRWLARLGGPQQRHIFLSETMLENYAKSYLSEDQRNGSLVVPNAFLFARDIPKRPQRKGPLKIGHLSVMSREKGVDYILALIEMILPKTDFNFVLAGPIADDTLQAEIERAVGAHRGRIEWLGPVTGDRKTEFYESVDLFLLPSRLIDEADPLVLLEAFAAGTLPMASNRGCIPDRVFSPEHLLTMVLEEDVKRIMAVTESLVDNRNGWALRCQDHARALCQAAQQKGQAFLIALKVG